MGTEVELDDKIGEAGMTTEETGTQCEISEEVGIGMTGVFN